MYLITETEIACEDDEMVLKCPQKNLVISVKSAHYGRAEGNDGICYEGICHATLDSLSIVKQQCDGMSLCTISVKNDIFGDPCPNDHNYLEVSFECEAKKGI